MGGVVSNMSSPPPPLALPRARPRSGPLTLPAHGVDARAQMRVVSRGFTTRTRAGGKKVAVDVIVCRLSRSYGIIKAIVKASAPIQRLQKVDAFLTRRGALKRRSRPTA